MPSQGTIPLRVLLISWEFPGVHSPGGAALSRRVAQVAHGLAARGWEVSVAYRDHNNSRYTARERNTELPDSGRLINLIGIGGPPIEPPARTGMARTIARRVGTAYHALRHGDRSGVWGSAAAEILLEKPEIRPDIVVGFFTPRGPLLAARTIADRLGITWIADLQDSALEGSSAQLNTLVSSWMRRTLRSAGAVVHVSPEWAAEDSRLLGREIIVMRHAVPTSSESPAPEVRKAEHAPNKVRLLYAGNINPDHQNPAPLMRAIDMLNRRALTSGGPPIELRIAAPDSIFQAFITSTTSDVARSALRPLGWLDQEPLMQSMLEADALVLIPWATSERLVVPSKLFQYLATGTPVLLAGPDSGGMKSLFVEWDHPAVEHDSPEQIAGAIAKLSLGDLTGILHWSRCGNSPFSESDLVARYSELAQRLVTQESAN